MHKDSATNKPTADSASITFQNASTMRTMNNKKKEEKSTYCILSKYLHPKTELQVGQFKQCPLQRLYKLFHK